MCLSIGKVQKVKCVVNKNVKHKQWFEGSIVCNSDKLQDLHRFVTCILIMGPDLNTIDYVSRKGIRVWTIRCVRAVHFDPIVRMCEHQKSPVVPELNSQVSENADMNQNMPNWQRSQVV